MKKYIEIDLVYTVISLDILLGQTKIPEIVSIMVLGMGLIWSLCTEAIRRKIWLIR